MKNRLSSIDVAAECACLSKKLIGLRLTNVYDINAKTYVLKLSRSGEDGEKHLLLIESGSRFHTIETMPEKADVPSNFTLKLRKHLRTRRLEAVRQLGVDRIVDFVFGSGEAQYHLILEMYSQGNVILTDSTFEVLSLLRSHRDDDSGYAVMARHPYPIGSVRLRHETTREELTAALDKGRDESLKAVINTLLPFGPAISERVVLDAGLDPSSKPCGTEEEALFAALARLDFWFASLDEAPPPGFISLASKTNNAKGKQQQQQKGKEGSKADELNPSSITPADPLASNAETATVVYSDFNPMRPLKGNGDELVFPTFDACMLEFFSKIEGQRAAVARAEAEKGAVSKLEKIRHDQGGRVNALQKEADEAELRGTLIEYNLDAVNGVLDAINEALASGMDWRELEAMIKAEKRAGNPVAGMIHSLQLNENSATILLSNYLDADEGDDEALTRPATKVTVDLSLSAYSNACVHYDTKKKHAAKQVKTLAANEQAIKAAEKKALLQLQKVRSQPVNVAPRKPAWFEKFIWFISSENYLVISGRDAQQNELIVKRYFRAGDAYVHAELHGASSTIIKNPTPEKPIPPTTLQQAGCACVCRSRAWDSKIVTSAWWVSHSQVSKSAPAGEYLPTGSFMIRGRKNFLPPQTLVMGFGFMFKLEEGSISSHLGERAPRILGRGDAEASGEIEDDQEIEIDDDGEGGGEGEEEGGGNGLSALDQFMEGGVDVARSSSLAPSTSRASNVKGKANGLDKYGLQSAPQEEEVGDDDDGSGHRAGDPRSRGGQGGKKAPGGGGGGGAGKAKPGAGATSGSSQKPPAAAAAPPASGVIRGKKGKVAKMKDKYADQDEEDRLLALQLLQSQGDKKSRSDRRKERKEKKEAKRKDGQVVPPGGLKDEEMVEAIAKATAKQFGKKPDAISEEEEDVESDSGSDSDDEVPARTIKAQDMDQQLALESVAALDLTDAEEKREIDALMKEEGEDGNVLADEDREKLTVLDSLTGLPRSEDLLLSATPVCGPYSALQQYKYKVKITPGTVKKGKAARSALELLIRGPEVTQRERELLKSIPEQEMINAIMGNCRLAMVGLQKLKASEKSSRKAKAKAEKAEE